MDALKAIYESLRLRDSRTYVQSGNVLFKTRTRDLKRLAAEIEAAIHQARGFHADVIPRTTADLESVIERNPFAGRAGVEPAKLVVTFLAAGPAPQGLDKIATLTGHPEELRLDGRELYIYFPNGMGQSKLPFAALEKAMKTPGTARNWNSVNKPLELARQAQRPLSAAPNEAGTQRT